MYDPIGRKTFQCEPDNASSNPAICSPNNDYEAWSYSGNNTTYSDETRRQWIRATDAHNRLVQVTEPGGLNTSYTYDALDNLSTVSQLGTSSETPRNRGFVYDSLSRLISATNPESGTVGYAYILNGGGLCAGDVSLPCSKTDARGVTTNYTYEPLNRLVSRTYSGQGTASAIATITPSSCYQYDTGPSGATGGNFVGRLTFEWTQFGSCPSTIPATGYKTMRSFLAYDQMGRVKVEQQCNLGSCTTGQPYTVSPSYDLAGNLTAYDNGLGTLTVNNSYDLAGRLYQVGSNINDATHPQSLYSVSGFTPFGTPLNSGLGANISIIQTYDLRLRPTGLAAVKQ